MEKKWNWLWTDIIHTNVQINCNILPIEEYDDNVFQVFLFTDMLRVIELGKKCNKADVKSKKENNAQFAYQ